MAICGALLKYGFDNFNFYVLELVQDTHVAAAWTAAGPLATRLIKVGVGKTQRLCPIGKILWIFPTRRASLRAPRASLRAPRASLRAPRASLRAPRASLRAPRASLRAPRASLGARTCIV
jgi:hypothetical protein